MIFRFKNQFFRKIKQTSVRLGQSNSDYRRILLFIQVIIIASFGLLVASVFDLLMLNDTAFYIDTTLLVCFISTLFFIYHGKILLSQILILLFANALFMINGLHEGREAGNQYLFFPYVCALFILFPTNEHGILVIGCITGAINFFILEYFDYHLWTDPTFTKEFASYNYIFCIILSMGITVIMLYYLISINKIHEQRLHNVNAKLKSQNKTLKKTNAELDSFVYKTSHDLRAPLTSVLGLVTLVKSEKDPQESFQYVNLIEKSIKKLDGYITDVLSISRNARSELIFTPVDIKKILEDAFEEYSFTDQYAAIERRVTIDQKCEFHSDQMRIIMIVNNLISNSFRYHNYTKDHKYVHIYVTINPSLMELTVSDNGIGIDPKHLKHIFDMFYRATNVTIGSGLGLYIVKEAIEKLNGTVNVKSVVREDTQITIRVPNQYRASKTL